MQNATGVMAIPEDRANRYAQLDALLASSRAQADAVNTRETSKRQLAVLKLRLLPGGLFDERERRFRRELGSIRTLVERITAGLRRRRDLEPRVVRNAEGELAQLNKRVKRLTDALESNRLERQEARETVARITATLGENGA